MNTYTNIHIHVKENKSLSSHNIVYYSHCICVLLTTILSLWKHISFFQESSLLGNPYYHANEPLFIFIFQMLTVIAPNFRCVRAFRVLFGE